MTDQVLEVSEVNVESEVASPQPAPPLCIAILQEYLLAALITLKPAVGNGKYIPILANVFIDATNDQITLWATDLQTYVRVRAVGKIWQSGQTTVDYKALVDLVKSCPPERIDITDDPAHKRVWVSCGEGIRSKIATLPVNDFPAWPNESQPSCVVDGQAFGQAVVKSASSAIKESNPSRPILKAINVRLDGDTLTLTASDGNRIASRTLPAASGVEEVVETNVDAKELKAVVAKLTGNVLLAIEPHGLTISAAHADVYIRAIDGKFPDVSGYLANKPTTTVQIAAPVLLQAFKRADIFARDVDEHATSLTANEFGLTVSAASQETGDSFEQLPATLEGENIATKVNARAVIDLLTAIGKQDVVIQWQGSTGKAVLFRPADDLSSAYALAAITDKEARPTSVNAAPPVEYSPRGE